MGQKKSLLLLEDVDALGRSGQVVEVKKGFARNFLIPRSKATLATKHALRIQVKLQEERAKQAVEDKKDSEALAKVIEAKKLLSIEVKVDPEGKLYGSVAPQDVSALFAKEDIEVDRKYIQIAKPIKETGTFDIPIHLKEDVVTKITLEIKPEGGALLKKEVEPEVPVAESVEESTEEKPAE